MNITMLRKSDIKGLKKSEMKDLNITKISHENGVKCIEFFNSEGIYRVFSKKTNKAIKKALKTMRKAKETHAA